MSMPPVITESETLRPPAGAAPGTGAAVPDARLRHLADGALRGAARAAGLEAGVDARTEELIGQACAAARDRGVRAEQLVLLLKQSWRELPEARCLPRHHASAVLVRAITVCIQAYYTRRSGDP